MKEVKEYIKRFDNHQDYISFINSNDYAKPNVSSCSAESHVHYDYDYAYVPLTVVPLEDITIKFTNKVYFSSKYSSGNTYYSVDGARTWTEFTSADTISVEANKPIQFKGNLKNTTYMIGSFIIPGKFNLKGNPLSMTNMDNFGEVVSPTQAIAYLFSGTGVVSAEEVKTNVGAKNGYVSIPTDMFSNLFVSCYNLVKAVNLRNLTRKISGMGCCSSIFARCSGLTEVPDIIYDDTTIGGEASLAAAFAYCTSLRKMPRIKTKEVTSRVVFNLTFAFCDSLTELPPVLEVEKFSGTESCAEMFMDCTALETVPKGFLPLTELPTSTYYSMFRGCTSLKNVPDLPSPKVEFYGYAYMFSGCTSLETVPRDLLTVTSVGSEGCEHMFDSCTSLRNAPELPATSVASRGYVAMFANCTSLKEAPSVLQAMKITQYAYASMFSGCTSLETAPEIDGVSGSSYCMENMFDGCTSLVTGPSAIHVQTLYSNGRASGMCKSMFAGCSSLETAPVIETENLTYNNRPVEEMFMNMFNGCSSLGEIKVGFKSTVDTATNQLTDWVKGVADNGTFYMPADSAWEVTRGDSGVPTNWNLVTE